MNRWERLRAACVGIIGVVLAGGCQLIEDPFVDPIAGMGQTTTASVEGVRAAGVEPELRQRPYTESTVRAADGTVTHSPLYFEDAPDTAAADDGRFAWTGTDWLRSIGWGQRFLYNVLFFPISAVVDPPWTVMVSDGEPSRTVMWAELDAQRRDDAGGVAGSTGGGPQGDDSSSSADDEASTHG